MEALNAWRNSGKPKEEKKPFVHIEGTKTEKQMEPYWKAQAKPKSKIGSFFANIEGNEFKMDS